MNIDNNGDAMRQIRRSVHLAHFEKPNATPLLGARIRGKNAAIVVILFFLVFHLSSFQYKITKQYSLTYATLRGSVESLEANVVWDDGRSNDNNVATNDTTTNSRVSPIAGIHSEKKSKEISSTDPVSVTKTNTSKAKTSPMEPFFPIRTKMIEGKTKAIGGNETLLHDNTPPITFLVILSGEFGNNLQKSIYGWTIAKMAYDEFGLRSRLVFSEQLDRRGGVMSKAKRTSEELTRCMPYFDDVDLELGNKLLGSGYFVESTVKLENDDATNTSTIRENLQNLAEHLNQDRHLFQNNDPQDDVGGIVPRVMVRVDNLNIKVPLDLYYDEIYKAFAFDDATCCGKTLINPPESDESVLHYRNFASELKMSRRKRMGFMEMTGDKLVSQVLGHLNPGDKIAVAGRFLDRDSQNNQTEAYELIRGLERKNLTVRFTPGSGSMEDFCFLKKTRKELIGPAKSSFVQLASYLGGPSIQTTRLYSYSQLDGIGEHTKW
eukprot:CAMPEP_0172362862 /NCGR_PEP_ID=MMETSP1060-20121228/6376_1 /TAXON_ID=37318 /ORGANISM="Pseudo-nitzschia pungens, Strain cf. cingulata" /LENGTH=491 /DNA_ID=CAMNT_0013085467 /DNA_START=51 /DNA_END=1523 /DNA_ORIENTATION=+